MWQIKADGIMVGQSMDIKVHGYPFNLSGLVTSGEQWLRCFAKVELYLYISGWGHGIALSQTSSSILARFYPAF